MWKEGKVNFLQSNAENARVGSSNGKATPLPLFIILYIVIYFKTYLT